MFAAAKFSPPQIKNRKNPRIIPYGAKIARGKEFI